MGRHVGWRIVDRWKEKAVRDGVRPKTPQRYQAWVRAAGGYEKRSFGEAHDAKAWAIQRAAQVATAGQPETLLLLDRLIGPWAEDLRRQGRVESYRAEAERQVRSAIAAGCSDLRQAAGFAAMTRAWLDGLRPVRKGTLEQISASTRAQHLRTLRSCVHWALRQPGAEGVVDPLRGVTVAVPVEGLRETFSVEEGRRLVVAATASDYGLWVAIGLYAGLRSDEAANLTWTRLDQPAQRILIRRDAGETWRLKRSWERIVPYQAELAGLLEPRRQAIGQVVPAVAGMICRQRQRLFAEHLRLCQIEPRGRTYHCLRHTWIAWMLATGEPSISVQMAAGHRVADTTGRYARETVLHRHAVSGWGRGEFRLLGV
jgi:integrase